MGTVEVANPALRDAIMKGLQSKAKTREALDELDALKCELEELWGVGNDALEKWEDGDGSEEKAEGKEELEQWVIDLDGPLTQCGLCCGMKEYTV